MKYALLILFSIALIRCDMVLIPEIDIIIDTDTIPDVIDTSVVIQPQPIIVDTCEVLEHLSDTAFTVVTLFFINGKPDNAVYKYGNDGSQNQIEAESLEAIIQALYPQYTYTLYESDFAVTVIVDGVNNNALFQSKFWSRDNIGQKALATAYGQAFYPFGSMTYEQSMYEAAHRLNWTSFHFTNTAYTPDEYSILARTLMHFKECKAGEYRANFHSATGIAPSVIDSSHLYEWELVVLFDDMKMIKA